MEQMLVQNDNLSFKDNSGMKHGLHGHVSIYREDPETKKLSLWDEADNIIPISGYQWILMKMFDLFLDSKHNPNTTDDEMKQDTTIAIPDLNNDNMLAIGTDPNSYTDMDSDISEDHFIQGFMVGNGASGEDLITAKNTDYSFVNLRNPIPFQQTQGSLDPEIAGKYLGMYRTSQSVKSYYVKKFDERPHIVHSWWKTGQAWNYVDPVTKDDLGPDAVNGVGKTNRIESYVSCTMTIDNSDFVSFFTNEGNNQSAIINELGLVAFNTVYGARTIMEQLYERKVKPFLNGVFTNETVTWTQMAPLAEDIRDALIAFLGEYSQSNLQEFLTSVQTFIAYHDAEASVDDARNAIKDGLGLDTNIKVVAMYNQSQTYMYETDDFLTDLHTIPFSTTDEAQRIKLITYYTFKAIPIETNTKWVINYRIYAN